MQNTYNLYNLEASFKKYLLAGIKPSRLDNINDDRTSKVKEMASVTVKNYLSDFRHFVGWLIFKFKVQSSKFKVGETPSEIISLITQELIEEYKSYLLENNIPSKTINRRLSTVRKFCSFCISQGWIKENPAKRVSNVNIRHSGKRLSVSEGAHPESDSGQARMTRSWTSQDDVLQQYEQHLVKQNLDKLIITSSLNTVQELLQTI